jgi:hypothetical protein
LCLAATGCDSSPFAASVNGQLIKETSLNHQLALLDANQHFITTAIEAPENPEGGGGEGIQVKGDGSSTYTTQWSSSVLTAMITASVVHQHLSSIGDLPTPAQTQAARAVAAALYSTDLDWYRFPAEARDRIAEAVADLAQVVPADKQYSTTQFRQFYTALQDSLFTNICIRDVGVDVVGPNGVDYGASLAKATALQTQINAAGVSGAGNSSFGGSVSCYSHAAYETLPLSTIQATYQLKTGTASKPVKTADGYQVTAVMSRALVPFASVVKATSVLLQVAVINSAGSTVPVIEALMAKAHVKVDPQYGTWKKTSSGYAIVPPTGPAAKAATAAGSI